MILLRRIYSYSLPVFSALSFVVLLTLGRRGLLLVFALAVIIFILLGQLLKWEWKRRPFWIFLSMPLFYHLSAIFLFVWLEQVPLQIFLGIIVTFGMWLYSENIFTFYYQPASYQAYALEYLSLVLYVLSGFFFSSGAYATQLFLSWPVWLPALIVFWVVLVATFGVLWVSKVEEQTAWLFSLIGAIALTELYLVLGLLPISFLANAGVFSIGLYLFLGLSRAHLLDKLTTKVIQRYAIVGGVLLLVIFATSHWV
jgi:hypothetical protein